MGLSLFLTSESPKSGTVPPEVGQLAGLQRQRCKLNLQLKWSNHSNVRSKFVYCSYLAISQCVSVIMVTITGHIFINIFRMEHFSPVELAMSYEKNKSFLVILKSQKV